MSKLEHVLFIFLIVTCSVAVVTNYAMENRQAALWALMTTLWTANYYMLKRKVS